MPVRVIVENDVILITINGAQVTDVWQIDELDDQFADATAAGELFDHPLFRVILFGEPCDETDYRHRLALKEWAEQHAPWHPCLHPNQPIDQRLLPATDF